jgi:hypothetical protein
LHICQAHTTERIATKVLTCMISDLLNERAAEVEMGRNIA